MTDPSDVHIQINRNPFLVRQGYLNGAQIRALPCPSVRRTDDLWLEALPGDLDTLVDDDANVLLRDGLSFFTVPQQINAG